jgi:hypothetical protein
MFFSGRGESHLPNVQISSRLYHRSSFSLWTFRRRLYFRTQSKRTSFRRLAFILYLPSMTGQQLRYAFHVTYTHYSIHGVHQNTADRNRLVNYAVSNASNYLNTSFYISSGSRKIILWRRKIRPLSIFLFVDLIFKNVCESIGSFFIYSIQLRSRRPTVSSSNTI